MKSIAVGNTQFDIDRLHSTIEKLKTTEHLPRRAGKTTAQFVLLIGELEVGDTDTFHLVVAPSYSYALCLCEYFCFMLNEAGVEFGRSKSNPHIIRTPRNQTVCFMGCHDVHTFVKGRRFRTVTYDIPLEFNNIPGNLKQYIQLFMEETTNVIRNNAIEAISGENVE